MHSPSFLAAFAALSSFALYSTAAPAPKPAVSSIAPFFQPNSVSVPVSESFIGNATPVANANDAKDLVASNFVSSMGMKSEDLRVTNAYTSSAGVHHIYVTQMYHGIPIANAVSNTNVDSSSGRIISSHQSFVPDQIMARSVPVQKRDAPIMTADQAVLMFAQAKGFSTKDKLTVKQTEEGYIVISGASFALQPIRATQKYYQTADSLVHTWDLNVLMDDVWENVFVDSGSGKIVGVSTWTADAAKTTKKPTKTSNKKPSKTTKKPKKPKATPKPVPGGGASYSVIPIGSRNPESNKGLTQLNNPADKTASPAGWHSVKGQTSTGLSGNNAVAQSNGRIQVPKPNSATLQFNYKFNAQAGPEDANNANAATVNMFYVTNSMHDILYHYGFDEVAGNFQADNGGKGGAGNDPVIANSQDKSGTNNANFATPPDGQSGRMRMYVFDITRPHRDGALDNDIIAHEIGHGLSNRLTGGPSNANCLQSTESGGLGEGWSDFIGLMVSLPKGSTRTTNFAAGYWAVGNPKGARQYPYSTSMQTNMHRFSALQRLSEVHQIGEVWCTILYEALWNLVDVSGFSDPASLISSKASGTGNTAMLHILLKGMKMQPCNPTFIQARDAIISAETALYKGKFKCALWNGFAKRGLGTKATSSHNDSFDIPSDCKKTF
ncbi:Fungalysin metallopeptidase-domain-containing protein [Obelidium mucronatum]|nr:Fungalysin metallopeptidase-domain-containing protein [Obelidium mucronatum]